MAQRTIETPRVSGWEEWAKRVTEWLEKAYPAKVQEFKDNTDTINKQMALQEEQGKYLARPVPEKWYVKREELPPFTKEGKPRAPDEDLRGQKMGPQAMFVPQGLVETAEKILNAAPGKVVAMTTGNADVRISLDTTGSYGAQFVSYKEAYGMSVAEMADSAKIALDKQAAGVLNRGFGTVPEKAEGEEVKYKPTNYPEPYIGGGEERSSYTRRDKPESEEKMRELARQAAAPSFFMKEKQRDEDDVVGSHPIM